MNVELHVSMHESACNMQTSDTSSCCQTACNMPWTCIAFFSGLPEMQASQETLKQTATALVTFRDQAMTTYNQLIVSKGPLKRPKATPRSYRLVSCSSVQCKQICLIYLSVHVKRFTLTVAKCLGTRLLILQCVFSVCNVWLPSRFRNAICYTLGMQLKMWLVYKHPSQLRIQLKYPVYRKLCTLTQVYLSQHCSGISSLIVAISKWQKSLWVPK